MRSIQYYVCYLGSQFLTYPQSLSLHPVTSVITSPSAGQVRYLWLFLSVMGVQAVKVTGDFPFQVSSVAAHFV